MIRADQSEATDLSGRTGTETRDELPETSPGGMVPFRSDRHEFSPGPEQQSALPDRYEVRDRDDGRVLLCGEAPGVAVSIDRHHQYSETDARRLGQRIVLLDGAGQFGPVIDNVQYFYNLDHHQDCLRAFTLATCQQAMIVVLKGLELDRGDWTIFANEPDLDTVFAVWILLNYRRVRELSGDQRDAILPLIHLEAAIDANGFDIAEHCGLPQDLLAARKARLDELHAVELELKRSGGWASVDLAEYSRDMLLAIDKLVYQPGDFADYTSVEEVYGHVDIGENRVAVVCRDASGIYEVERRLKKSWGDRLGVVALERSESQYTLRRTASMTDIDLEQAYGKLNLLDPMVDGRPPEKRWGGSDDIGGSPRPEGTALTPREIAKIIKLTYRRVRPLEHLLRFGTAALWVVLLVLGAGLAVVSSRIFLSPFGRTSHLSPSGGASHLSPFEGALAYTAAGELALAAVVIGLGAWLLTRKLSRGWTWLFGWRHAAGRDWLALVPLVLLGAAGGGAWMPRQVALESGSLSALAGSMILAALALELCFRGLVHGLLVLDSPVQTVSGRWFVSRPVVAAAVLYALATVAAAQVLIGGAPDLPRLGAGAAELGLCGVAALVAGIGLGMIRERSLSLWPAVGAAIAGGAVRFAVEIWLA